MKTLHTNPVVAVAVGLIALCGGCATVVPAQLSQARDTYTALNGGLAAELSPAELSDAKAALDRANRELEEHGDTNACRDYAYIAQNKLELADSTAHTELDRRAMIEAQETRSMIRRSDDETSSTAAEPVQPGP
jgi:uncharacterized membrane protein YccC